MKSSYDIVVIGSALRDTMFITDDAQVLPNPSGDMERAELMCVEYGAKLRSEHVQHGVGGGAANAAVNFAALGLRTSIVTALGNDSDADLITHKLRDAGIQTRYIQHAPKHQTGFSFVLVDRVTSDHTAFIHYGATTALEINDATKLPNSPWYYISSLNATTWKTALRRIFKPGRSVVWNPGNKQLVVGINVLKPWLKQTAVLIVNKDEAISLTRSVHDFKTTPGVQQLVDVLRQYCPGLLVITDGRNGSYVFDGHTIHVSAPAVSDPVDTTGAGDRFGSSFVTGLIKYDGNIDRSLELASYTTTKLVKEVGAQSGLVQWEELPGRLKI